MYKVVIEEKGVGDVECFFFNDTATTEIYTLSLHDALPISLRQRPAFFTANFSLRQRPSFLYLPILAAAAPPFFYCPVFLAADRKSTRLNSSHQIISYAVFCLKKKKKKTKRRDSCGRTAQKRNKST